MLVIDGGGNLFDERRKTNRRKSEDSHDPERRKSERRLNDLNKDPKKKKNSKKS